MSRSFTSLAFRLSLLYAALLAVIGIQQPFWPVWLAGKGLNAAEIGLLLALSIGVKVISAPLVAHLADRSGERKWLMIIFAAVAIGSFATFLATEQFWPILIVSLVYFAVWPPVVTLAESVTMQAAKARRLEYGRVRLWGSLSFIVAAAIAGQALTVQPPSVIYWMIIAVQLIVFICCCLIPDRRETANVSRRLPVWAALCHRPFACFLIASGLIQASHAVYYAFATLAWKAAGHSEAVIGLLWAEGVLAEIVLFVFGLRLIARFGPRRLLALAGAAAAVRWLGTGLSDALPALIVLQTLHALSFGAAHLAAMHYISEEIAADLSATAQSLYSGVVWGLFLGGGLLTAGLLFERMHTAAFLPMVIPAIAGCIVAIWPTRSSTTVATQIHAVSETQS